MTKPVPVPEVEPAEQVASETVFDRDVTAAELAKAPDPVWPRMPRSAFTRIGGHLRDLADDLGLRDWKILLSWEPCEDAAEATVNVCYGRRVATVFLAEEFAAWDDTTQHHALVHELLHCHLDPVHSVLRNTLPALVGAAAWTVLDATQQERVEHVVDALAAVMAPRLPGFDEET